MGQILSSAIVNALLEELGILPLLLDSPCDMYTEPYASAVRGWNTGKSIHHEHRLLSLLGFPTNSAFAFIFYICTMFAFIPK
jgi:hypothetical protein